MFLNLKNFIFISLIFPSYKLAKERISSYETSSTISCECDMNEVKVKEVSFSSTIHTNEALFQIIVNEV